MAENFQDSGGGHEKIETSNKEPRRNTKRQIIQKIKQVCEEHGLTLEESDTSLQRSSKTQLQDCSPRRPKS